VGLIDICSTYSGFNRCVSYRECGFKLGVGMCHIVRGPGPR
jgi:hypothetical protein